MVGKINFKFLIEIEEYLIEIIVQILALLIKVYIRSKYWEENGVHEVLGSIKLIAIRPIRAGIQVDKFWAPALPAPIKREHPRLFVLHFDADRVAANILLHHPPSVAFLSKLEHHEHHPLMYVLHNQLSPVIYRI